MIPADCVVTPPRKGGFMRRALLIAALFTLAGCAVQPPSPADIQAKRFESVPGKAVIYIVRDSVDSPVHDMISLDGDALITTHPKTYYRWEVAPGAHDIRGYASSTAAITVNSQAGQVYFVQHVVHGNRRAGVQGTYLKRIDPDFGRELVSRARLL
jgi:hypothetical protein